MLNTTLLKPVSLGRLLSFLILNSAFLIHCGAQPPSRLTATNLTVMVNTNGVLLNPTNFFHANQAALHAEVTNAGSSSSLDPNALHATNNLSDLTSVAVARANLGLGSAATNAATAFQPAAAALSNLVNGLSNSYFGTFSGNGAGLSNLNASQLSTGLVPDSLLSSNVALRNGAHAVRGIFFSTSPCSNTNTSETVVYTNILPAGTLAVEGDSLEGWISGLGTNNTSTKTVRVYLGASLLLNAGLSANNVPWRYDLRLLRGPSPTNQILSVFASTGSAVIYNYNFIISENLATNLGFGITLTGTTGTGDLTLRGMKISKFPSD